jgi:hypothetical protein
VLVKKVNDATLFAKARIKWKKLESETARKREFMRMFKTYIELKRKLGEEIDDVQKIFE